VIHFDGFYVSIYFATFPSEYLMTLRNVDISVLKDREEKIKLNHTKRYNLLLAGDRTDFIREFVALLRFIAAGEANIGHLQKDSSVIHRTLHEDVGRRAVLHPPQEAMDESEEGHWRDLYGWQYED
jgi:hypothetical protein